MARGDYDEVQAGRREELQKAVLTALAALGFFTDGVFRRGTALRLIYRNRRPSEDLDFVFRRKDSEGFARALAFGRDAAYRLGGDPEWAGLDFLLQKDDSVLKRAVLVLPSPRLRLNLEFANIRTREERTVIAPFPPSYPALRVESESEILADKMVALGLRPYLKGRDLWDIFFLTTMEGVEPKPELVRAKLVDYSAEDTFWGRLAEKAARLRELGPPALDHDMRRFLPAEVLASYSGNWDAVIQAVVAALAGLSTA